MRHRHEVVELESITTPGNLDVLTTCDQDAIELIDETRAPEPILREAISGSSSTRRPTVSALPTSQPITPHRPNLPWGLGTDGWPRHNSRLVRLFACVPEELVAGVVGRTWGCLSLADAVRPLEGDVQPSGDELRPLVVDGELQMPYPSRPLSVELRAQPFHDRYCRVDLVLRSHRRWPRRYFDVASRCLSRMQHLERVPMGG